VPKLEPCKETSDCASGYHCELHGTGLNTRSCEESGTCNASEAGEGAWLCAPDELSCDADSDCPEPAVCAEGECVYELNSCEADSDCDARYVCAASKDEHNREPSAQDGGARAVELIRMCFPPPVACENDADCDGWECHVFPKSGNPPIGWEDLDKSCMPPGLVALIEERIEPAGDLVGSNDDTPPQTPSATYDAGIRATPDSDAADKPGATANGDAEAEPNAEADADKSTSNEDAGDHGATKDAATEHADDSCNVSPGRARAGFVLPAWLALALLGWRRTKRRAAR
jgi:hypothetical protein